MPECIEDGTNGWSVENEEKENEQFLTPDDTPEEISSNEIKAEEIITPEIPTEDTGHLTELVCDVCLELNLTTKSSVACAKCGKAFCFHFASSVDAQYCVNCLSDISVTKQVVTKIYEHKNTETGQKTFYRRRAREVKLGGLDWLFAQRKIYELSDVELDLSIEYHRNILGLMIAEQERQRNAAMHRYAGVQFKMPKIPDATKVSSSSTTTVKKTRIISKDKASEQLAAILKGMLAKGLTPEQIAAMMKK